MGAGGSSRGELAGRAVSLNVRCVQMNVSIRPRIMAFPWLHTIVMGCQVRG
jgi:hypothetical protein